MFNVRDIHKNFGDQKKEVRVLNGLNFSCGKGEFTGIFGASGTGKSTFLHILGGLDKPDSGQVLFNGEDIFKKNSADFRNKKIGFVFQFYHLLPEFLAIENVMLPCLIAGIKKSEARLMSEEALKHVGLLDRADHKPSELSGGEQQRVAIARATVMKPGFILADEPTGNLDEATGNAVFSYLERLNKEFNIGIIMVTHNPELLKRIPRRLELKGGILA